MVVVWDYGLSVNTYKKHYKKKYEIKTEIDTHVQVLVFRGPSMNVGSSLNVQRYSAPQSPIVLIMRRPLDCSSTVSIACLSSSDKVNPNAC